MSVRGQKERDELFFKHRYGPVWLERFKDYYTTPQTSDLPKWIHPNWCLLSTLNPRKIESYHQWLSDYYFPKHRRPRRSPGCP